MFKAGSNQCIVKLINQFSSHPNKFPIIFTPLEIGHTFEMAHIFGRTQKKKKKSAILRRHRHRGPQRANDSIEN